MYSSPSLLVTTVLVAPAPSIQVLSTSLLSLSVVMLPSPLHSPSASPWCPAPGLPAGSRRCWWGVQGWPPSVPPANLLKIGVGFTIVTLRLSLKRNPLKLDLMSSRLFSIESLKLASLRFKTWPVSSQHAWYMYLEKGVVEICPN